MSKIAAMFIGMTYVDRKYYGDIYSLPFCKNNVDALIDIIRKKNSQITESIYLSLIGDKAKKKKVKDNIQYIKEKLHNGDFFILYFTGHGTIGNYDPPLFPEEGKDEAWMLYDQLLFDDELTNLISLFEKGVKILIISDSCYSEGMIDILKEKIVERQKNNEIQKNSIISASGLLLAACCETCEARSNDENKNYSKFTGTLKDIVNEYYQGTYQDLISDLKSKIKKPEPKLSQFGIKINPSFEIRKAFLI